MKYCETSENRLLDILEKFRIAVDRQLGEKLDAGRLELADLIESRTEYGLMTKETFAEIHEQFGITIRESLYD